MEKQDVIFIIPSYKCNGHCSYCYARRYSEAFSDEMSLIDFFRIVNAYKKKNKNLKVSIIGGEPAIWKPINLAILYCRMRNIVTSVYTNGMEKIRIVPDILSVNIFHYFDDGRKSRIIDSLEHYKGKIRKMSIRYNIEKNDSPEKLDVVIELAKRYDARIEAALAVPFVIDRAIGEKIFSMTQKIVNSGIRCFAASPMPPCMFTEDELIWLKKNVGQYSGCSIAKFATINPDGKTLQACSNVFVFKKAENRTVDQHELEDLFMSDVEMYKRNPPMEKCHNCGHYKKGECFGGCFSGRT